MPERPRDDDREQRIHMEIVVDEYDREEQALGWYSHLDGHMNMPFLARCTGERRISTLQAGDEIEVFDLAPEDDCRSERFVMVHWEGREVGVPLAQLDRINGADATHQAIADWRSWFERGSTWS